MAGEKLGGYVLEKLVGAGGQGAVYLARDEIGKARAVKVIPRTKFAGSDSEKRLVREADALEALRDKHIVAFYAIGLHDDLAWLAMEYVEGESLAQRVNRAGKLPEDEAVRILEHVLLGLCAAHDENILHRDLSAGNVMLSSDGRALLTDFGLAKRESSGMTLTDADLVVGTCAYIAPEIYAGERPSTSSDLWSVGVLACQAATGQVPYRAESVVAIMRAVCDQEPDLEDVTGVLLRLAEACLIKSPSRRIPDARTALQVLRGERQWTGDAGSGSGGGGGGGVSRRVLWIGAAAVVLAGAGVWAVSGDDGAAAKAATSKLVGDVRTLHASPDLPSVEGVAELRGRVEGLSLVGDLRREIDTKLSDLERAARLVGALRDASGIPDDAAWEGWMRDQEILAALACADALEDKVRKTSQRAATAVQNGLTARLQLEGYLDDDVGLWRERAERFGLARDAFERQLTALQPRCPQHGESKTTALGIEVVYVAPRSFRMGSPTSEEGRAQDELQHDVRLTRGYWIAVSEITRKQWREVMDTAPWGSGADADGLPASNISWRDAMDWIRRARDENLPVGWSYDLPSEAEWECAARARTQTRFGFEDDTRLGDHAWYRENADALQPVMKNTANAWGLHDMHGNVMEWCLDAADYRNGLVTPAYDEAARDPRSEQGERRVLRGGCWHDDAAECRSAERFAGHSDGALEDAGFRVVLRRKP